MYSLPLRPALSQKNDNTSNDMPESALYAGMKIYLSLLLQESQGWYDLFPKKCHNLFLSLFGIFVDFTVINQGYLYTITTSIPLAP